MILMKHLVEMIAYICRSISHTSTQALIPYVVSSTLSLVAPALFAASIYMILGRIIRLLRAKHHSPIRVKRLTKIFVTFDVISFWIQASGAGLQAGKDEGLTHTGQIIVVAALFMQIIFFGLFVVAAGLFHARLVKQPTALSHGALDWKRQMYSLYIASGLILLRNMVRAVEYIEGYEGNIKRYEWFLYAFDTVPMFGVMLVMAMIYAPLFLKQGLAEGLGDTAVDLETHARSKGEEA